jgi:hypothetical protein
MALLSGATTISPTIDTFDPSAITGTTYKVRDSGFTCWGMIKAPPSGGPHALVFKCATPWKEAIPGGSFDPVTGYVTLSFPDDAELRDVQVTEIVKAGSAAGVWTVAP